MRATVQTGDTPQFERMPMKLGQVIYESGETLTYAYFPIDCIISLLYVMEDGDAAETAMVGNEDIVGVFLVHGGATHDRQSHCVKRRPCLPAEGAVAEGRIQSCWSHAAPAVAFIHKR